MMLYVNILSVVLLALVAGLLMTLWVQLREWRVSARQAPLLAEQLAAQLMQARSGLEELKRALVERGPELSTLLSDGNKMRTELMFLLQKAEQVAAKMERVGNMKATKTVALVEEVAGANGQAVQPSHTAHDPLEDLLVSLSNKDDNILSMAAGKAKRKRTGPVTQAELDLQQKVAS